MQDREGEGLSPKIKSCKLLITKVSAPNSSARHRLHFYQLCHKHQQSLVALRSISLGKETFKEQKPSDFLCFAGSLLWHSEIFLFCNGFGHEVNGNTSGVLLGPALQDKQALL